MGDVSGRCWLCHPPRPIKCPFPFADKDVVSTPNMVADGSNLGGITNLRDDKISI